MNKTSGGSRTTNSNKFSSLSKKNTSTYESNRPNTSVLDRSGSPYRSIEEVEQELNSTFQNEMSNFVKTRIRKITSKNKQLICIGESMLVNPEETLSDMTPKPRNLRQMRICSLSQRPPQHV
jgi:hypothetical protein